MRVLLFLLLLLSLPCLAETPSAANDNLVRTIQLVTMLLTFPVFFGSLIATGKEFTKSVCRKKRKVPPENISPAEFGFLVNGHMTLSDQLISMLLEWARLGMICFDVSKRDMTIRKISDAVSDIKDYEKELFGKIFYESSTVPLKKIKEQYGFLLKKLKNKFNKEYNFLRRSVLLLVLPTFLFGICTICYISKVGKYKSSDDLYLNIVASLSLFTAAALTYHLIKLITKKIKLPSTQQNEAAQYEEFLKSLNKESISKHLEEDPRFFEKIFPYINAIHKGKKFLKLCDGIVTNYPDWFYRGQTVADFRKSYKRFHTEPIMAFIFCFVFGFVFSYLSHHLR